MGRTSNQKIIYYIVVWLFLIGTITASVFVFASYEEKGKQRQITILLKSHPELEAEIIGVLQGNKNQVNQREQSEIVELLREKYGYSLTNSILTKEVMRLWCFLVIVITESMILLFDINRAKSKKLISHQQELLEKLYEQLEDYRLQKYDRMKKNKIFYCRRRRELKPWNNCLRNL